MDPRLRGLLVCPACRGELDEIAPTADGAHGHLGCRACGRRYPVVDGTPWLVEEHAIRP